jgi:hypothetical protein
MVTGSDAWERAQARAKDATREAQRAGGQKAGKGRPSQEVQPNRDLAAKSARSAAGRLAAEVGVSRATMERAEQLQARAPELARRVAARSGGQPA